MTAEDCIAEIVAIHRSSDYGSWKAVVEDIRGVLAKEPYFASCLPCYLTWGGANE